MKKGLILIAIMMISGQTSAEVATKTVFVKPETENFRIEPSGEKIGVLNQGASLQVLEKKNGWLKVSLTGWIHEPSTTMELPKLEKKESVEFVKHEIEHFGKNYKRSTLPYYDHIRAAFQFKNNTKKTVVGIVFKCKFMDSFNEVLYESEFKDQNKIKPGKSNSLDTFWYWKDNQFDSDEIYDKLFGAVSGGTIKAEVKIKKVAFSDGSLEEF